MRDLSHLPEPPIWEKNRFLERITWKTASGSWGEFEFEAVVVVAALLGLIKVKREEEKEEEEEGVLKFEMCVKKRKRWMNREST